MVSVYFHVSVRPNYFIIMGYKKNEKKIQQSEAHTFIHTNPLSRNPGSATATLFYLFGYGHDVVLLSKLDILRPQLHCMQKTTRLIHSMIITAISTGSKTRLAAKCTVGTMMGPKQSIIHFDGMKAKLANVKIR